MANMGMIEIHGHSVNSNIINQCIVEYEKICEYQVPCLTLVAGEKIIEFDYSLIGHFILFKEECTELSITIILKGNNTTDSDSITWKLMQQMVHAYYCTNKNIFTLVDGNGEVFEASTDKDKKNRFVLSDKFLPIIFLNKLNYKKLFQTEISFLDFVSLDLKDKKDEEGLYQACRRTLFKQITKDNYIEILVQLAFYRALVKAKILRYYLLKLNKLDHQTKKALIGDGNENDFQVGTIKYPIEKQPYWDVLTIIFNELEESTHFSVLLFSTFISSNLVFKDGKNLKEVAKKIKQLWNFTKELFYGIDELSKNIIEHADTHKGIISGFIKDGINEFELSIFDHGTIGITQTFTSFLENKKAVRTKNIEQFAIQHDIDIFKKFRLSSFFDTDIEEILNEQASRATAHLGLLFLSKLIKHNNEDNLITDPLKVVSTNKVELFTDSYPDDSLKNELPNIGTYYKIALSLSKEREYTPFKPVVIPRDNYTNSNGYEAFFKFKFINDKRVNTFGDKDIYCIRLSKTDLTGRLLENLFWNSLLDSEINEKKSKLKIISIDFSKVIINASQLFRFLATFELSFPNIQLIIFNIETQILFDLNKINDLFFEKNHKVDYWNKDKAILIFSYVKIDKDKKEKDKFYFTDVLWGKTKDEFYFINEITSQTHFNSISREGFESSDTYNYLDLIKDLKQKLPQPFFDKTGNLLHLNLLIEDSNLNNLFNYNAKTLLQNVIYSDYNINKEEEDVNNVVEESGMPALINSIKKMQAYKIPKSHFRLGSKIHITDFYYAKPFFQNSFFAYKYALMIAYDLINSGKLRLIEEKINKRNKDRTLFNDLIKEDGLTIIGYGLYSELLISYVKEFLENYSGKIAINTNTVTDAEDCKLNKPITKQKSKQYPKQKSEANHIYSNVIIIVPIATTFSTSIKIRKMLIEEYDIKEKHIIKPYFNILAVVDSSFENIKKTRIKDGIFNVFGWENINKKKRIVLTRVFERENGEERSKPVAQKYYITLTTNWYNISECKDCFPDKECMNSNHKCLDCQKEETCILNEKPLFVTDNTSLTPELILGLPVARKIEKEDANRKLILSENSIKYGHIERNNNHYHYYFNDDEIWSINKEDVKTWLKSVENEVDTSAQSVILSPCHFSNAGFVEMVNLFVFGNKATIVHYDQNIENDQNFKTFYGKTIGIENNNNAIKIYFVDDALTSGLTFISVNSFLQRINSSIIEKKLEFEACFFFINRSGYYEYEYFASILGKNKKIFSYANLHLPYIKSINSQCPLCDELKKYEKLYENSYLTRIKLLFLKKQRKLRKTDIYAEYANDEEWKIGRRLEVIHRMYDLFSVKQDIDNSDKVYQNKLETTLKDKDFYDWVQFILNNTSSSYHTTIIPSIDQFLKIDDTPKEGNLLTETEISVLKCLTQSPFYNYKEIRKSSHRWVLQLLEKKINQIKDYINKNNIINGNSLDELKLLIRRATLLNSNYIISYKLLHLLKIFYSYPHVLINKETGENFAKESLSKFSTFFVAQVNELLYRDEARSKELNVRLKYFNNLPNDENEQNNSKLFRQLIRMLLEENAANIRAFAEAFEKSKKIKEEITENNIELHYKLLKTNYQSSTLSDIDDNKMQKFLKIRLKLRETYLDDTENNDEPRGENDINQIKDKFEALSEFIDVNMNEGGCFAIVKYKKSELNPFYLLYNEGIGKRYLEHNEEIYFDKNKFFMRFLDTGQFVSSVNDSISIIEFHRDKTTGNWTDLFTGETANTSIELCSFPIPPNINRFLLLRIDRDQLKKNLININSTETSGNDKDEENNNTDYNGQAVIGFYFNVTENDKELTDIQKIRFLLLLRGDLSRYLKNVVEQGATFRDFVENERKNKEYIIRYRKNTHGAKMYLDNISSRLFDDDLGGNPNLFAVAADLFIGEIHYSLLINEEKCFGAKIYPIEKIYPIYNKQTNENWLHAYVNCIVKHLTQFCFNEENIIIDFKSIKGKMIYYSKETPFLLFQFINNIISHTDEAKRRDAIIKIFVENEYLIVKNSNAKISREGVLKIQETLNNKKNIPYESISLFVINHYIQNMCNNEDGERTKIDLIVEFEEESTFVVKIPIIIN